jgi:acetaldehyde dehydrogenase/alcohol dehydrogenase
MTGSARTETHEISKSSRTHRISESSTMPGDPVVEALVNRALAAQRDIDGWSEEQIDVLLRALASVVKEHARPLAVATVAETGMGNVRDKTLKNSLASVGVYGQLAGQVGQGQIGFDRDRRVAEIASPVGVIVGLVPATHPVATFIFKSLIAIKGRNAIIFSPSRRAQHVSQEVGRLIQQELRAAGAPTGLVQWLETGSTRETTAALMSHRHVALVLATGGRAMVKAAYRSGTPAIGVGPGNAPALISNDADLQQVARSVVLSKSFDNGLICGAENHLVVEGMARPRLVAELIQNGAAVLTESESARFRDAAVNPETHRLMSSIAGHDAATLARLASIERPYHIQLLVIPTESVDPENYLAAEKLAPVVSLFTVADMDEGIQVCRALLYIDGTGHTAIIHTRQASLTQRFTTAMPVSRVLVNSPATQGLMGLTTGLIPSMTLGCGTWGGTSTTNSVSFRDLLNIKRVAYCTPEYA